MRIITRVWKQQPGRYFCISTKSASGAWKDNFFRRGEFNKITPFIEDNLDKNVYWCPHGFDKRHRHKDHAVLPSLLWADLDETDPDEISIRPTIAWESSPGRYAGLWLLDKEIDSDDINRALTYEVGADKGGWDLTQVLRVPGTKNYKYQSQPKARLLWSDGKTYQLADLKRKLKNAEPTTSNEKPADVWKKYERKLPRWVRKEILNGRPVRGKRSDMIWKIEHALIDAGVPLDDAIIIIQNSEWNKFAGRRDEEKQLRREFEKIVGERLKAPESEKPAEYKFLNVTLDEIEEKPIDWLWYPYLARGELTILEGDPGVGKSYLMQMISKAICDGEKLPTCRKPMSRKIKDKVAYFDVENSGPVSKSRMMANGLKNLKNYILEEEPFSVDDDDAWDEVLEAIERTKPALVVFYTMNTYIGMADTNNAAQAQQAFGPFRQIARQFNCAVCVIRHWTKGGKDKSLIYRGQGSIAFTGLARVVMAAISHPEEEGWNLLAITKINVAKKPAPLSYAITSAPTLNDPDRSKFIWGSYEEINFEQAVTTGGDANKGEVGEHAEEVIVDLLKGGKWVSKADIIESAETKSVSKRTVERALSRMIEEGSIGRKTENRRSLYRQSA